MVKSWMSSLRTVSNNSKRLIKGGFWATSGKIIGVVLGLIVSSLLTHLLSPVDLGAYYITVSIVVAGEVIAQLGLPITLVKLIAEFVGKGKPEAAKHVIIKILRILLVSSVIVSLLFLIFGNNIVQLFSGSGEIIYLIPIIIIWIIFWTFQDVLAEVFRGYFDIKLAVIFGSISTTFFSMILFSGIWILEGHSDLKQIIILSIVSGFITLLIASASLYKKIHHISIGSDIKITTDYILRISLVMWVTNILLYIWAKIDIWIMGIFTTPDQVAIYGTAIRLVILVSFPYIIISSIITPYIAEMNSKKDNKGLENGLKTASTIGSIPSMIMFIFVIFFGFSLLKILFGEYYTQGYQILVILGFGQLINILAGFCGEVLLMTGYQAVMLKVTLLGATIALVITYLLVNTYGGIGVAIGMATGIIFQNIVCLLLTKKYLGIWTNADFYTLRGFVKKYNSFQ